MLARIKDIPELEDATWGAVLTTLLRTHPNEWTFHWTAERPKGADPYSQIDIEAAGDDVEEMRAEIDVVVDLVNRVADRDPLKRMVRVDVGHVEVLVS